MFFKAQGGFGFFFAWITDFALHQGDWRMHIAAWVAHPCPTR
jgi:hypothetical protein